ncbi:MAG TPA: RidA family protein [Burkholderiaceae bacterium]|nr:RidA family protein [Burkholderiaceae bacterium]
MTTIKRTGAGPILSQMVEHGDTVYLCGLTAEDRSANVKGQTEQILTKIDELLTSAGTSKSRILTATVYVPDIRTRDAVNEAWKAWIDPENPPARAMVQTTLGLPEILVEIVVTAAKN